MNILLELIGNLTVFSSILFILGIVLLGIELFIPGFGVFGITGAVCIVIDMFLIVRSFAQAAVMIGIVAVLIGIMSVIVAILASKGRLPKPLILRNASTKEDGFSATDDYTFLVGKEGIAQTQLRPSGKITVDSKTYDVVSDGQFIDAGSSVKVISADGNIVTVEKI